MVLQNPGQLKDSFGQGPAAEMGFKLVRECLSTACCWLLIYSLCVSSVDSSTPLLSRVPGLRMPTRKNATERRDVGIEVSAAGQFVEPGDLCSLGQD